MQVAIMYSLAGSELIHSKIYEAINETNAEAEYDRAFLVCIAHSFVFE